MAIQKANGEGHIYLEVSDGKPCRVQLDVTITPIFCASCNKQLPDLYLHKGSRYGFVGTVICDFCGTEITCSDHDNIIQELYMNGYKMDYYLLYNFQRDIWSKIQKATGYEIGARHGKKVLLKNVIEEICQEGGFELPPSESNYISYDGKITKFPESVVNWFRLLDYLELG